MDDSPFMTTLKEKARAELHLLVERYLADTQFGFSCLEPCNYPWEVTKLSLPHDLQSFLQLINKEKDD